jgi:hypothetical protein
MFNPQIIALIQQYWPSVKIAYKDQTPWMVWLGKLLGSSFMNEYATTVGSTIYFPSTSYINAHPITSIVLLIHELTHVDDESKWSKYLFGFLYLLPQILALPCLLLLFILSWKIVLPLALFFLLPLPAYFRTLFEERAYIASLYAMQLLKQKGYAIDLPSQSAFFVSQFTNSEYYWMGTLLGVQKNFDNALTAIQANQKPFTDDYLDKVEQIIALV